MKELPFEAILLIRDLRGAVASLTDTPEGDAGVAVVAGEAKADGSRATRSEPLMRRKTSVHRSFALMSTCA